MKHFVVMIEYTVPAEQLLDIVAEHREFLTKGYEEGLLLLSGPRNPRTGAIAIARAESIETVEQFFLHDTYHTKGVAEHHFIEFQPVLKQDFLKDWVEGSQYQDE